MVKNIGNFQFIEGPLKNAFEIRPRLFNDSRGYFMEAFRQDIFEEAGIYMPVVQMNVSKSCKGVLRGLHFQKKYPQAKLVRVLSGEIFDVIVDLRQGSDTFGKWMGIRLSAENKKQLYIPRGFAHGFLVLSETVEFSYLVDENYHPEDEGGILWNDKTLNIDWPLGDIEAPILSNKDSVLKTMGEIEVFA